MRCLKLIIILLAFAFKYNQCALLNLFSFLPQNLRSKNSVRFRQIKNSADPAFESQIPSKNTNENLQRILENKAAHNRHAAKLLTDVAELQKGKLFNESDPSELHRKIAIEYEHTSNINQAHVLEFQADRLARKAERRKDLVAGAHVDTTGFPICNITKIGELQYIPASNDLATRISDNIVGHLKGGTFTVLYKNHPKLTYEVQDIELPIYNLPDVGNTCFAFHFFNSEHVFCTPHRSSRNSWINALTEAWFCQNEGLQSLLPAIEAVKEGISVIRTDYIYNRSKKNKSNNNKQKHLVDIELHMNKQGVPKLTLNGKDISSKGSMHF